jgi:BMFP domain-containing protein YqiC
MTPNDALLALLAETYMRRVAAEARVAELEARVAELEAEQDGPTDEQRLAAMSGS